MKTLIYWAIFILLTLLSLGPASSKELVNQQKWEEDINYFHDTLIQKHLNLFHTVSKQKFNIEIDSLISKIPELNESQIIENQDRIYELYLNVMNQASFNFGALEKGAFASFKAELKTNFILKGYYLEGNLIGFSSAFLCNELVDASFVGIDYEFNFEHCLYQRMLYDLVDLAITKNVKELRLGRTAEEIKSGIGAIPVHMHLYMRHRNAVSNKLLKPIIESISPSEFEVRQPFKVQTAQ